MRGHVPFDPAYCTFPSYRWRGCGRCRGGHDDREQPLSDRLRARDLAALNITSPLRFVSVKERVRFLQIYSRSAGKPLVARIRRRVEYLLKRRKFRGFHEAAD